MDSAYGSVYMSVPEAPVREIMRDMLEMSRGVQHPIRGPPLPLWTD